MRFWCSLFVLTIGFRFFRRDSFLAARLPIQYIPSPLEGPTRRGGWPSWRIFFTSWCAMIWVIRTLSLQAFLRLASGRFHRIGDSDCAQGFERRGSAFGWTRVRQFGDTTNSSVIRPTRPLWASWSLWPWKSSTNTCKLKRQQAARMMIWRDVRDEILVDSPEREPCWQENVRSARRRNSVRRLNAGNRKSQ